MEGEKEKGRKEGRKEGLGEKLVTLYMILRKNGNFCVSIAFSHPNMNCN